MPEFSILSLDWIPLSLVACLACFAGFVKGITGFAFPMIMFGGLAVVFGPELAVAALALPLLAVNIIQAMQGGLASALWLFRRFFRLIFALCIAIAAASPLVTSFPPSILLSILGPTITIVATIQLFGRIYRLPRRLHRPGEYVAGVAAGLSGGFAGVWAPLIVLFLLATGTDKSRQVQAQGVIYAAGSVVLIAAHSGTGVINSETLPISALLLIPAAAGLGLGTLVRNRLNQERFRYCTLVVLIILGLNLVWRAVSSH